MSATLSGSRSWRIVDALTQPSTSGSASGPSKIDALETAAAILVDERVRENAKEPRLEVRARLELFVRTDRLDHASCTRSSASVGLRVRRHATAYMRVHVRHRFGHERVGLFVFLAGCCRAEHRHERRPFNVANPA